MSGGRSETPETGGDPTDAARRRLRRLLADGPDAWFVGGAVRERLAGRATSDLDVAIAGDEAAARIARSLAREAGAHAFPLSDAFGAWRVVGADADDDGEPAWQVDLTPLQGDHLASDLARRDLTVNAIAEPVVGGSLVDPHGGVEDLAAGRLRMVGPGAFAADLVRVLRLARFAAELGFSVDPATLDAARAVAPALTAVPGERMLPELRRLFAAPAWRAGWDALVAGGALGALFPDAVAGPDGGARPALSAALVAALDPAATVPEGTAADRARLAAATSGADRRLVTALALLLDGAGRPAALARLRPSRRLRTLVERTGDVIALTRAAADGGTTIEPLAWWRALRPLGGDGPVAVRTARAVVGPVGVPWGELLARAVRWATHPPVAPVRGDRLAEALGLRPGPEIGALLERLALEADAGRLETEQQAVAQARAWGGGAG